MVVFWEETQVIYIFVFELGEQRGEDVYVCFASERIGILENGRPPRHGPQIRKILGHPYESVQEMEKNAALRNVGRNNLKEIAG